MLEMTPDLVMGQRLRSNGRISSRSRPQRQDIRLPIVQRPPAPDRALSRTGKLCLRPKPCNSPGKKRAFQYDMNARILRRHVFIPRIKVYLIMVILFPSLLFRPKSQNLVLHWDCLNSLFNVGLRLLFPLICPKTLIEYDWYLHQIIAPRTKSRINLLLFALGQV